MYGTQVAQGEGEGHQGANVFIRSRSKQEVLVFAVVVLFVSFFLLGDTGD